MRCIRPFWPAVFLLLLSSGSMVSGLTLDQLKNDPELTPERFASYFARFQFSFRAAVQAPEVFLANRTGDCDGYAIVAAEVLKARGYTPRLIAVRMKRLVHVVCYIAETGAYLDFNQRTRPDPLIPCGKSIHEIAESVAESFKKRWWSASEFTFGQGIKRLVRTIRKDE